MNILDNTVSKSTLDIAYGGTFGNTVKKLFYILEKHINDERLELYLSKKGTKRNYLIRR